MRIWCILTQKIAGLPYTVVGDEINEDFTYVTDIADAIITVGNEGKDGSIYNIVR